MCMHFLCSLTSCKEFDMTNHLYFNFFLVFKSARYELFLRRTRKCEALECLLFPCRVTLELEEKRSVLYYYTMSNVTIGSNKGNQVIVGMCYGPGIHDNSDAVKCKGSMNIRR